MMYCKYCGKEIPEESKFCRHCGKQLIDSQQKISKHNDKFKHEKSEATQADLNKTRDKWVGWVLVIISSLGLLGTISAYADPALTDTGTSLEYSPLPYIIDLFLGIQLLRHNEKYLGWIFWRVILGLILWGVLSISENDIGSLIAQIVYSAYIIYLVKFPVTKNSLNIANYILLPLTGGLLIFIAFTA